MLVEDVLVEEIELDVGEVEEVGLEVDGIVTVVLDDEVDVVLADDVDGL